MAAYVSKYALSTGIVHAVGKPSMLYPQMFVAECDGGSEGPYRHYFHEGDWHTTYPEAAAKAEAMRTRKIASLEKQIAKLKALKF